MNTCIHQFRSGVKKDQLCNKPCEGSFCTKHCGIKMSKESVNFVNNDNNIFNNNQCETLDMLALKLVPLETSPLNKSIISKRFMYVQTLSTTSTEYQKNLNWIRYALNFPYNKIVKIPVSIHDKQDEISKYVSSIYKNLNDYIYGMQNVKEEILSFICKQISNPNSVNPNIALCGNNGVGKTRLAHGLAKALNLPIKIINLGMVPDVYYFTGHGFTYVDSEPGRIVQILIESQCKNCIIYFDELDKIQTEKGRSIYSFLTHMIDPSQNSKFQDVYLSGLELDVSQVLFIFSFNDEELIDKTVKDRLKIIKIPDPNSNDKFEICKKFIIPELCNNVNYKMSFEDEFINDIIRANSNLSLRQIRILFEDIISKMNMLRMLDESSKNNVSFYNQIDKLTIDNIVKFHHEKNHDLNLHSGMYS